MRIFNDSVVLQFDSKTTGNSGASIPVTVRDSETGVKAALFSDNLTTPTVTTNPVISGPKGNYSFYVADGTYDVIINEGVAGGYTLSNEQIYDLVALTTLGKVEVIVVEDQLVYPYPASVLNVFSVNAGGEYLLETVDGYTNDSVAKTITLSEGLAANEVMEWETSLIPAPIFPVPLPTGFYGSVTYSAFGADATGGTDTQVSLQNAINFCSINQVKLLGQIGNFKCLSALMIPKQKGFIWESPNLSVIDSSAATTAFITVDAYSDRAAGVSGDFTEGLRINGGRIIPSSVAGSYGMGLFYMTNTSSIRDVEIRGGDNGLLLDKEFYGFFENIKIKDSAKIGLHLLAGGTNDTGINANYYKGLWITGCENNLVFIDTAGSFSNVAVFDSCTFENSRKTSVIINGVRPVKFLGCYSEGNYTNLAAAGEVTDFDGFDTEITLDHCFINVSENHDSGAYAVKGDASRITDTATYKAAGVLSKFYDTTTTRLVYTDDSPNSDFSNASSGYDRKLENNAPITQIFQRLDSYTADRTIAAIGGNVNNAVYNALTPLVNIDLTTAQLRAGWTFEFHIIVYETNSINLTRRGVSEIAHISVFKDGINFDAYVDVFSRRERLSSQAGTVKLVELGSDQIQLQYDGAGSTGLAHLVDIQYQLRNMVCRNNGDIVTIDKL